VQVLPSWLGALVSILPRIRLSEKITAQNHTVELSLSQRLSPGCSITCFLKLQCLSTNRCRRHGRSEQEPDDASAMQMTVVKWLCNTLANGEVVLNSCSAQVGRRGRLQRCCVHQHWWQAAAADCGVSCSLRSRILVGRQWRKLFFRTVLTSHVDKKPECATECVWVLHACVHTHAGILQLCNDMFSNTRTILHLS